MLIAACFAAASEAVAKPPAAWTGKIVRYADADTLWIERGADEVKIRLHLADAPEVAHTKNGVGQAGGVAAVEWAEKQWPIGTVVRVKPKSLSYDRIVADVDCEGVELGLAEVRAGFAMVDPRYKPPAEWKAAEATAKEKSRGIWNEAKFGKAVPPWEWRKAKRNARFD